MVVVVAVATVVVDLRVHQVVVGALELDGVLVVVLAIRPSVLPQAQASAAQTTSVEEVENAPHFLQEIPLQEGKWEEALAHKS